MMTWDTDLETIVGRFGSDNLPRYIGERFGLVQVLVSDCMCSAKVAEAEEVTMIMLLGLSLTQFIWIRV